MSRYIDEEWLKDNAKEYSLGYYEEDEWATPLNVLDSAPSIDITRCKDCIWWGRTITYKGGTTMIDCKKGLSSSADGYCYLAERRSQ